MSEKKSLLDRLPYEKLPFDRLQIRKALLQAKKMTEQVVKAGELVVQIAAKPTTLGMTATAVTMAGNYFISKIQEDKRMPDWPYLQVEDLSRVVHHLEPFRDPVLKEYFSIGGQRFYLHGVGTSNSGIRAERHPSEVVDFLRDQVWAEHGERIRYTGSNYLPEPFSEELTSPRTDELWDRISKRISRNYPCSVALDGPPGSGKSTMARVFASRMGGRIMRVCLLENGVAAETMARAIRFLKPRMMVIDDFDRCDNPIGFLDFLEKIRSDVKLFVVTTNEWSGVPKAVRRPGRFDEVFFVECLGRAYLEPQTGKALWEKLSPEQQKTLESWPSSYIQELRIRDEIMGADLDLAVEFEDLIKRMA